MAVALASSMSAVATATPEVPAAAAAEEVGDAPVGPAVFQPEAPASLAGWLSKQTHGAWVRWHRRHFLLKDGCVSWSASELATERPEALAKASCVDFSAAPCELTLLSVPGSLELRPLKGRRWPRAARHFGAGTSRPLRLQLRRSWAGLAGWEESLAEHVAFGQVWGLRWRLGGGVGRA